MLRGFSLRGKCYVSRCTQPRRRLDLAVTFVAKAVDFFLLSCVSLGSMARDSTCQRCIATQSLNLPLMGYRLY